MKKIDKSYLFLGVLILAGLGYRFYFKPKKVEMPKYGNYLSCIGTPFDLKVKFKSEVYLLEKAMPENEQQKKWLYFSAAVYQNLYAFSNILQHNPSAPLKWSSFVNTLPKVNVLSDEKAEYPHDVEFETDPKISGFPPEADAYIRKLMPFGKVSKGEPARKVTYELESDLLTCFTEPNYNSFKDLKIYQPIDPYLSYFAVPKAQRMKLKNPVRFAEGVFNPCMDPGGITASGFQPFGFWNFWIPEAKGHSADKEPFDCSLFYQVGKNLLMPKVTVEENTPKAATYLNFKHFEGINRPIKMSILVGGQESKIFQKLDKDEVNKFVDLYLSDIDLQSARKELPKKYDAHFAKILILLFKSKNHMEIFSKEVNSNELSVDITLRGKLKLSKKDIELHISLAPNNPEYDGADIFAKQFVNQFMKSDVVVYEGHAATGNVFADGLKILKEQNYANQDKSIQYQIFGIYSCSSMFYYNPSEFPKIDNPGFKRDVVRTAGAYLDGSGNGSLALIASLDQYLYNESYVPFAYWAKNFKSDNFYILTNH